MLLETEANNVRLFIQNAMTHVRSFGEEISDAIRKIGTTIQHMEGSHSVIQNSDGLNSAQQVTGVVYLDKL